VVVPGISKRLLAFGCWSQNPIRGRFKGGLMDSLIEGNVEPRKQWVAPELKKIDIEAITQLEFTTGDDGILGR